jgi:hypothetical protein|tara:strand:+ start:1406 stop:1693 length:288 start_codon:yes stop_codon:yes gene_type:complete
MITTQIELQENSLGELFFELPPNLLDYLDSKKGDDLKVTDHKNGVVTIKKIKYETIELDFDDEELLKYMKHAHEKGMSFNEWVENVLTQMIEKFQ